jgi:hypothetical protein
MPGRKKTASSANLWIATVEPVSMREGHIRQIDVNQVAVNVNLFLEQMGDVLSNTPEKLGRFHLDEIEVHADISAEGQLILLGTGGRTGLSGGVKFVFRRTPQPRQK